MSSTQTPTFATLLRRHRRDAGLTQEELAERAGLSVRAISDLERGVRRSPQQHTVRRLAEALSLSPEAQTSFFAATQTVDVEASDQPAPTLTALPSTQVHAFLVARMHDDVDFVEQNSEAEGSRLAAHFGMIAQQVVAGAGGQLVAVRDGEALGVFASARRALHAAMKLQARFAEGSDSNPTLQVGIGLAAGDVVRSGDGYHSGAIQVATHLSGLAVPGEILASETITSLAGSVADLEYRDRGQISSVEGAVNPVRLMQITVSTHPAPSGVGWYGSTVQDGLRRRYHALPVILQRVMLPALAAIILVVLSLILFRWNGQRSTPATASGTFRPWGSAATAAIRFAVPYGVAVDQQGNVYVADTANNQVEELSSTGQLLRSWGTSTGRSPQLNNPSGIAVGADGTVYVADTGNNRILKLSTNGTITTIRARDSIPHGASSLNYPLINPLAVAVGGHGNVYVANTGGNNIVGVSAVDKDLGGVPAALAGLSAPSGIAVDQQDNIYVTDTGNHRIQIFSPTYTPIGEWGATGSGAGQLQSPSGIAIDQKGNVYVTDVSADRILKFSPGGRLLATFGGTGSRPGRFQEPTGVAVDRSGDIYVADSGNARIQKLSATGQPLQQWQVTRQSSPRQIDNPSVVTVDRFGHVYVVSGASADHIEKFSASGHLLNIWPVQPGGMPVAVTGMATNRQGDLYVVDELNNLIREFSPWGKPLTSWGSEGAGAGKFVAPTDVAVDRQGNVYVVDSGNHRVQQLSPDGKMLRQYGSYGYGRGQFLSPRGIALDRHGDLYVADPQLNRIQEFSPVGRVLTQWGKKGTGPGEFNGPVSLALAQDGTLYVVDEGNRRVQRFSPDGTFLASWQAQGSLSGPFDDPVSIAADYGNVYVADRGANRIEKLTASHK